MTITERKALGQLVEAASRVPEYIADRYGLSEPLRILRDPAEHSRIARFFGSPDPDAVELGRRGGLANAGIPKPKSAENGKKGGRPKKSQKTPTQG